MPDNNEYSTRDEAYNRLAVTLDRVTKGLEGDEVDETQATLVTTPSLLDACKQAGVSVWDNSAEHGLHFELRLHISYQRYSGHALTLGELESIIRPLGLLAGVDATVDFGDGTDINIRWSQARLNPAQQRSEAEPF